MAPLSCMERKSSLGHFSTRPFARVAWRKEAIFLKGAGVIVGSLFMSSTPNQGQSSILTGKVCLPMSRCPSISLCPGRMPPQVLGTQSQWDGWKPLAFT